MNPGSVGQPRDGDPRAALGLLNPDAMDFTVMRLPYDPKPAMEGIVREGLHPYFAERLLYGR